MNVPRRQTDTLCLANASCRDQGPVIQPSSTSTSFIHARASINVMTWRKGGAVWFSINRSWTLLPLISSWPYQRKLLQLGANFVKFSARKRQLKKSLHYNLRCKHMFARAIMNQLIIAAFALWSHLSFQNVQERTRPKFRQLTVPCQGKLLAVGRPILLNFQQGKDSWKNHYATM